MQVIIDRKVVRREISGVQTGWLNPLGLRAAAKSGWFVAHMHLRFTDKELATLVEMVSLAANVAMWNRKPGAQEGVSAFEGMEQKILEKVKHAGQGNLIEFDEAKQVHQVNLEYQEGSFFQECYDEFRNECFWEEMVIRLADRDLARAIGKPAWEKLTEEQRRERTQDIEKRYWEEFTKKGIDRVAVIHPPGEG